jgi:hypothetical protein
MDIQHLQIAAVILLLAGCSKSPTPVVVVSTNNLAAKPKEVVMTPERRAYVAMKELLRRGLKVPSSAVFWAPYKPLKDVLVAQDTPDDKEVAVRYKEDYWMASGLVDCQAQIGNTSRQAWTMVALETPDKWVPIYMALGDQTNGISPEQIKSSREIEEERKALAEQEQRKAEQEAVRKQFDEKGQREYQRQLALSLRAEQQAEQAKLFKYRLGKATNGYPSSQFDLGLMYLRGEGTESNRQEGLKWIRASASSNNVQAIQWLKNNGELSK